MDAWMMRAGLFLVMVFMIMGRGEGQLVENFYSSTCPNVESTVQQAVATKLSQTFTTIPATLRLFFHDCFVTVCCHISPFTVGYIYIYSFILKSSHIDGDHGTHIAFNKHAIHEGSEC